MMIPNILKKIYEFIIQSFEIPYDINQYHKELYYPELPPEPYQGEFYPEYIDPELNNLFMEQPPMMRSRL